MGQRLAALDLAFLALETQRTPVNVGGLQIFEIPKGYTGNFVRDLLAQLREQEAGPPFNLRLSSRMLGTPEWVEDPHFDLDYHIRHSALPKPGSMEDLLRLVSRLHGIVMDRERPLWECHVIEGLRRRRFAIYTKMHHAAIDGMGGIEIMEKCFTPDPTAPPHAPWFRGKTRERRQRSGGLVRRAFRTAGKAVDQVRLSADLGRLLLGHGLKTVGLRANDSPVPFTAPRSMFNVTIGGARRFGVAILDLSSIKALGKAAGATVNDVVLAVCAGALRQYLIEHDELPRKSLVATVPVSVRQMSRIGSQITYVAAKLGTDIPDPLERLHAIGVSTMQAKREVAAVSAGAAMTFAVMAQGLVAVLNRFRISGFVPPAANVVISNVPGPRQTLYFGGAEMLANYPLSVLVDGQALNITVISYRDEVAFGLMADRDILPDLSVLTGLIEESLAELERAIDRPDPGRRTLRQARRTAVGA